MLMIFWWWWLIFLSFFPSLPESLSPPASSSSPLFVQAEIEEVKREVFTIKLQKELTFAHIF